MNTKSMQENLANAKARLKAIEVERDALTTFIEGSEKVLSLPVSSLQGSPATSIRDAIRNMLKEANGKVVNSSDITRRITEMNVPTTAKNLARSVDTTLSQMARSGEPLEKVAPKVWRWKIDRPELLLRPEANTGSSGGKMDPAEENSR